MKITFIIPGLPANSGGHRAVMQMAHYLEKFGHTVVLHFTHTDEKPEQIREAVNDKFFPFGGTINVGTDFEPCDILLATHYSTAKPVSESKAAPVLAYLVQDYEPDFYPVSSFRFTAEKSYGLGLLHICHGGWLGNKLRNMGYPAKSFSHAIDHDTYTPGPRVDFRKRVVLFGRPEMPRRCFELGALALAEIHKRDPSIKLTIVGSDMTKEYDLGYPAENLGHVTGAQAAHIYRNADLGMAFSTINVTGAAYDMLACGLPLLDIRSEGTWEHYGFGTFVQISEPDPEAMATDALALLANEQALKRRAEDGYVFASQFPNVEQMVRQVEALIGEAVLEKT